MTPEQRYQQLFNDHQRLINTCEQLRDQLQAQLTQHREELNHLGRLCRAERNETSDCTPLAIEDAILEGRDRYYRAELWASRLLGIGINQAVDEAERRQHHPLGRPEPWTGPDGSWEQANLQILAGASARLQHPFRCSSPPARGACHCPDCRTYNLDSNPPDIEGAPLVPEENADPAVP